MNIPILILNRDRFTYTEKLCRDLIQLGYGNIHIVDIGSTYEPLLEWYKLAEQGTDITIHYFDNIAHKGIWENGFIKTFDTQWVVVTDSDISLHPDTPRGFIEQMVVVAKDFRMDKCGLSIQYKNINPYLQPIIDNAESPYWKNPLKHNKHLVFLAKVDTTFCIVRPELPFQYQALRIADWPIKHLDWHSNWHNLTEEEQFYFDKADPAISTTKAHYLKWKSQSL